MSNFIPWCQFLSPFPVAVTECHITSISYHKEKRFLSALKAKKSSMWLPEHLDWATVS